MPRIARGRDQLATLPGFASGHFEQLELVAFALIQSYLNYVSAKTPSEDLVRLVAQTVDLKGRLSADMSTLLECGLLR